MGITVFKDIQKSKFTLNRYFIYMEKFVFQLYVDRDDYGITPEVIKEILFHSSKTIAIVIAELIMKTVDQMLSDLSDLSIFPRIYVNHSSLMKIVGSITMNFN